MSESQLALLRLYNRATLDNREVRLRELRRAGLGEGLQGSLDEDSLIDVDALGGENEDVAADLQAIAPRRPDGVTGVSGTQRVKLLLQISRAIRSTSEGTELPLVEALARVGIREGDDASDGLLQEPLPAVLESLLAPSADAAGGEPAARRKRVLSLARLIDEVAASARPADIWVGPRPPRSSPDRPSEDELFFEAANELGLVLVDDIQPLGTCKGALRKFDSPQRGGEYSVYLQTKIVFLRAVYPNLEVFEFWGSLLDPTTWVADPFWCAMEPVGDPDLMKLCVTVDSARLKTWLLEEEVGICDTASSNWYPGTVLCFARSTNAPAVDDNMRDAMLTYNLVPAGGGPGAYLEKDDGAVTVIESNDAITVTTTKELAFDPSVPDSPETEGQVLAKLACEMGWIDATRNLVLQGLTPVRGRN